MGAFSGLKDAKRGFSSNPLQEGKYVVRIDGSDFFEAPQSGECWKNTLTVLAVESGPHRVGEIVHTFFRVNAGKATFQQNLKSFIANVLNVSDEEVGEEESSTVLGPNNPMKGLVTVVTARTRTSKKTVDKETGLPVNYTVYAWEPSLDDKAIKEAIGEEAFAQFFPNG